MENFWHQLSSAIGRREYVLAAAVVAVTAALGFLLVDARVDRSTLVDSFDSPITLPATTTTADTMSSTTVAISTTTAAGGEETSSSIDPAGYGTDRPVGFITGILYGMFDAQGVPKYKAVCTAEVLLADITEEELLASGTAAMTDESLAPVIAAAVECEVPAAPFEAMLASFRGE